MLTYVTLATSYFLSGESFGTACGVNIPFIDIPQLMLTTAVSFPVPIVEYNLPTIHLRPLTIVRLSCFSRASESLMSLQNVLHINITCRPNNLRCPKKLALQTNQYSVKYYERQLEPHSDVPENFFKFGVDSARLTLIQRTTSFTQFFIRCVTAFSPSHLCPTVASA